jgi:tetratricopeptide (TPR) repeat protein
MLKALPEVVDYLQQALQLARRLQDADLEAFMLDKLGVAYDHAGFYGTAAECLMEGIEKARTHGNLARESSSCGHLGNMFSANGAFHKAEPYYKRALEIAQSLGDEKEVGLWLSNLGNNYLGLLRYDIAKEHYEKALSIARSFGDQETEERCVHFLTVIAQKLYEQTKERHLNPAVTPGAFVFSGLAVRVSQIASIEEKRAVIISQKDFINDAIKTALSVAPPEEALALIDCVKSLIGRELMTRRRGEMAGCGKTDLVVHGFNPSQVCEVVACETDLATVSVYYTEDKVFYAFLSFFQDGRPQVEKVVLASGNAGRNFHKALLMLAEKRRNSPLEDIEHILLNLVDYLGQGIVPRLRSVKGVKRVLLIPYKLLYLLPLHAMCSVFERDSAMLEDIGPITYAGSLYVATREHKSPGSKTSPIQAQIN